MSSNKVLYEWRRPKPQKKKLSDLVPYLKLFLRAYLVAMVFTLLIYVYLKSISSDEFDKMWDSIFYRFIPGSFGITVCIVLISFIQIRFSSTRYQVTEKGIRSYSDSGWFISWHRIQGFWTEPCEKNEDISRVVLLLKNRRRFVLLPQDKEFSGQIVQTILKQIPRISPIVGSPRYTISNAQLAFLVLFTPVYSYTLAYVCSSYGCTFEKRVISDIQLILLFSIIAIGPGTIGLAIQSRGRWNEFIKGLTFAYFVNTFAFMLTMFLFVLLATKYYLNQAGM